MTTNKQSEKREDSIRVIEGKTLKTLTKKENKMDNQINHALTKAIKSNSTNKKNPTYELKENSHLIIELPNGMDLFIYSNEDGQYCSLTVSNQEKSNFKTEITERTNYHDWGSVDKIEIQHDNYNDCSLNKELKHVGGKSLKIQLDNFINK
mgnify:CR=1 FL=1|jgi:hypothetical protein|tara:strand:+ start:167 stop:619 length:453 start_codon:yes stop_codon:yes gene_type:complete